MRKFISNQGLQNLKNYKYTSGFLTPLDKKMTIFWNKCSEVMPNYIHPNIITILAFVSALSRILLFVVFSYDFDGTRPKQVYLFAILSIFGYQTLDAIDGKQARKLKISSPLGQIFDHGLDSISANFLVFDILIIFCIPNNQYLCIGMLQFIMMVGVYGITAHEHFFGVLNHSNGVIGATEIQFINMFFYLLKGIFGCEVVCVINPYVQKLIILLYFIAGIWISFPLIQLTLKKSKTWFIVFRTYYSIVLFSIGVLVSYTDKVHNYLFLLFFTWILAFGINNIKLTVCNVTKVV